MLLRRKPKTHQKKKKKLVTRRRRRRRRFSAAETDQSISHYLVDTKSVCAHNGLIYIHSKHFHEKRHFFPLASFFSRLEIISRQSHLLFVNFIYFSKEKKNSNHSSVYLNYMGIGPPRKMSVKMM